MASLIYSIAQANEDKGCDCSTKGDNISVCNFHWRYGEEQYARQELKSVAITNPALIR